jgi:riboflavin biosynthesis pyrimidine reductase
VNLYRVIPPPPEVYDLASEEGQRGFLEHSAVRGSESVRAIMVTNSAGDTVDDAGTSESLSRGTDRTLLALLRENADAVIVGASTIRSEPVPLPRTTPLVVLSTSGNLHGHKLFTRGAPGERLVVASAPAHRESLADALEGLPWELLPWDTAAPPEELQRVLQENDFSGHLLVEGGRKVWEFCAPITTELLIATIPPPRDSHEGIPPWWPGSPQNWELRSLFTDDAKMLYYRHEIAAAARPGV